MSKSSDASAAREKTNFSLSNLLERPKGRKSTCSVESKSRALPCIVDEEGRRRRRRRGSGDGDRISGECTSKDSRDECPGPRFWLRPGVSLPKMRDAAGASRRKLPAPAPAPAPASPSPSPSSSSSSSCPSSTSGRDFRLRSESSELRARSPDASTASLGGGCFARNKATGDDLPGDDYANAVGPSECLSTFKVANSDLTLHSIDVGDGDLEESHELKNWERWMRIRRRQNAAFADKLNRDKCHLTMNAAENLRAVREVKEMFAYAQAAEKKGECGKNWKERPMLPKRHYERYYYGYESLLERGVLPTMEFVSVPDAIKREKDVFCKQPENKARWESSDYLRTRRRALAKKLRKMQPHKVRGENLIVVGEKIECPVEEGSSTLFDVPQIEVTKAEDEGGAEYYGEDYACRKPGEDPCHGRESTVVLVVNGFELRCAGPDGGSFGGDGESHTWSIIFEEALTGVITEKALRMENRGTATVRYEWLRRNPDVKFAMFPPRKSLACEQCFFFDKNPGIILPGQNVDVVFYHHSKNPGYHVETWYLKLSPNLFGDLENGKVKLTAVAGNRSGVDDFEKMDAYLDSRVKETVVAKIVAELVERVRTFVPRAIEYQSLFTEDELFEYQNRSHNYHYGVVAELKALYEEIPLPTPQAWDLSLFTLEELIRANVEPPTQRDMLCKLMDLTRALLRPTQDTYKHDVKFKMVYHYLCSAMNAIEDNARRLLAIFAPPEEKETVAWPGEGAESADFDEAAAPSRIGSTKSARSRTSGFSFVFEEATAGERTISDRVDVALPAEDSASYRHALHTMVFNVVCEAAERVAGIIESCKLFEHRGEVIRKNETFLMDNAPLR